MAGSGTASRSGGNQLPELLLASAKSDGAQWADKSLVPLGGNFRRDAFKNSVPCSCKPNLIVGIEKRELFFHGGPKKGTISQG